MPSKVACKSPKDAAFEENPKQNPKHKRISGHHHFLHKQDNKTT